MSFGKPRTDVLRALHEAQVSGVQIKIEGSVVYKKFEEVGWVKSILSDRVIFGRDKEGTKGVPYMFGDVRAVSLWEEPGDGLPQSNPDPEPVGGPPPKNLTPGKREKIPELDKV